MGFYWVSHRAWALVMLCHTQTNDQSLDRKAMVTDGDLEEGPGSFGASGRRI